MKTYKQFNEGLKDYSNQGKNVRVPGEDTASFGKLFKDDMKQMGKFKNPKTGKLEGNLFPDPRKGYQVKQFATGRSRSFGHKLNIRRNHDMFGLT